MSATAGSAPGVEVEFRAEIRHISVDVCLRNRKVAQELADGSPFRALEFLAGMTP